jgi:hypothetical protein
MRIRRYSTNVGDISFLASSRPEIRSQPHPTNFEGSSPQREDESEALNRAENTSAFLVPSHGGPSPINRAALSYTG